MNPPFERRQLRAAYLTASIVDWPAVVDPSRTAAMHAHVMRCTVHTNRDQARRTSTREPIEKRFPRRAYGGPETGAAGRASFEIDTT
jgi:hypothetical protein